MGTPKLKRKEELQYRRGTTSRYCERCNHFVGDFPIPWREGCAEPRCEVIGLETGRSYKINPANICDRYDNSRYLNRLINGTE
jgi:hypothetical protein